MNLNQHIRSDHIKRSVLQCGMAGVVVLLLLLVLDAVTQTVLIASLGASAFIAFAVPRSLLSGHRHMIGGYVVGMLVGVVMASLNNWIDPPGGWDHALMVLFGALAISAAMFLMVLSRTEHPPAVSLALGLVLNEWTIMTLFVILAGVILLSVVKRLVLPVLLDLV